MWFNMKILIEVQWFEQLEDPGSLNRKGLCHPLLWFGEFCIFKGWNKTKKQSHTPACFQNDKKVMNVFGWKQILMLIKWDHIMTKMTTF